MFLCPRRRCWLHLILHLVVGWTLRARLLLHIARVAAPVRSGCTGLELGMKLLALRIDLGLLLPRLIEILLEKLARL